MCASHWKKGFQAGKSRSFRDIHRSGNETKGCPSTQQRPGLAYRQCQEVKESSSATSADAYGHNGGGVSERASDRREVMGVRPEGRHRLFLVIVVSAMTLMFGYLLAQLVRIQIVEGEFYAERADRYHLFVRQAKAPRGRILDRHGAVLAESVPVKDLWARPASLPDLERVANRLAPVLDTDAASLLDRLQRDSKSMCLARDVQQSETIAELERAVKELAREGQTGLDLHDDFLRVYPFGEEAAHVIGCVGVDGEGLVGAERIYDASLVGRHGFERLERDGKTRAFYTHRSAREEPTPGSDVVLTIDVVIQHFLERQVQWAFDRWEADSVVGVVVSPSDGRVLALANRPSFDPTRLDQTSRDALRNRAVTDTFAPGSTFKPFVVAAALDDKRVALHETFDCGDGEYWFDRRLVHDVHPEPLLDVPGILVRSSNIGVAQIGLRLGGNRLREAVQAFGFGRKTGIGFGGESAGVITSPKNWTETYTTVSVSFGQEIASTPLQLALGFSALVNGGRYEAGRLLERLVHPDGIVETVDRPLPRQVVSPATSATIRELLVRVCEEGSGQPARVEGFRVGGKTGTSEKFKGKIKEGYISSFAAFAPAEDPALCVVFIVNEPKGARYGRVVAAPAVGRVLADSLAYLELPPTAPEEGDGGISRSADPHGDRSRYEQAN